MRVHSVFKTIQGEGKLAGVPMMFLRLQGCDHNNKPCVYCDTPDARDPDGGYPSEVNDVVAEIVRGLEESRLNWVCITGGEPLTQFYDVGVLVHKLWTKGYSITVETNGNQRIPWWGMQIDSWVADIKCPSSGVSSEYGRSWLSTRSCDQVKFVVSEESDLNWIRENYLGIHYRPWLVLSPCMDGGYSIDFARLVSEFCVRHGLRFSIQLHKFLGVM